ncbi:MAG: dUTP diphosphatase [Nannocystaceae bacterium]|nr:dUTP diphosphatase [Deltaproteobacteria bacterium]MBK8719930.1 dUTP diphosphatase [Deltaproteobacteria bacterium]MBP7291407.1 dUTP diphosphatase [Nannocystaceae bacterium]
MTLRVEIELLHAGARMPARMTELAAGYDLAACLGGQEIELVPGARARVPTGLRLAIPAGYEGQVRPRSGWAAKSGVTVLNAPGTIDADFRGELQVLLVNLGHEAVTVRDGDRIAQLVIAPVCAVAFETVDVLTPSDRGEGGFGSTGV